MINELAMEIKTLTELGSIFNGNSINAKVKKEKYLNLEEGIPYIATKDVSYLSVLDYNNGVKIPFVEKSNFKIAAKNTILICAEGGSAGRKIGFTNQEVCFGNKLFAFTPKNGIDSKYVYYFYFSDMFQKAFKSQMTGIIGGVSMNKFKQLEIPIPSLPQQRQIVAILDQAFAAIDTAKANAEQNLQNTKELYESYLLNIFENKGDDWVTSTIGESCNLMTGGTPSRSKKEYFDNGMINWLVSGDINKKEINDCEGKITKLGFENSNTKFLPINSVMIALNGQGKTRGTVAMLRIKATCNQSLVSIYPKDDSRLLPELIFANLEGRYNEIRKITGDSGNDRRGLNMPLIRKINFTYPSSISIQKKIIHELASLKTQTKKLEAIYIQKIVDLEEMKKSILQKAFSGQLKNVS